MFKKLALSTAMALGLATGGAFAAGEGGHVEDFSFSFEGPFGTYDQAQLQRGLKIYTEVCSACHGLRYVPIRTLGSEAGPASPRTRSAPTPSRTSRSSTRNSTTTALPGRPTTSPPTPRLAPLTCR